MTAPSGPAPLDTRAIREEYARATNYVGPVQFGGFALSARVADRVPALCDEVDRLRAENEKVCAVIAELKADAKRMDLLSRASSLGGSLRVLASDGLFAAMDWMWLRDETELRAELDGLLADELRVASTPEEVSRGR